MTLADIHPQKPRISWTALSSESPQHAQLLQKGKTRWEWSEDDHEMSASKVLAIDWLIFGPAGGFNPYETYS